MGAERFAAVANKAQGLDGFAEALGPVSLAGRYLLKQSSADNLVYLSENGGAWTPVGGGPVSVSLQDAYDGGNSIAATDAGGAIDISSTRTAGSVMSIASSGVGATTALTVSIAVGGTGYGAQIVHNGAVAGATSVALRLAGALESCGMEFDDGRDLALSNAGEARIRYNGSTATLQVSLNGAAYADFDTAAGDSLQTAYVAGPSVVVTDATGAVAWNGTRVSGDVFQISNTAVLSGITRGLVVDLSGATPGANEVVGLSVSIPASISASTRAVSISTAQTVGSMVAITSTGAFTVGTVNALLLDMSGATYSTVSTLSGLNVSLPTADNNSAAMNGIIVTAPNVLAGIQSRLLNVRREYTKSTASAAGDYAEMFYSYYAPVITAGSVQKEGTSLKVYNRVTASGAGTYTTTTTIPSLAHFLSEPIASPGGTVTHNSDLVKIEHNVFGLGGTLSDTATGLKILMYPASAASSAVYTGLFVQLREGLASSSTTAIFDFNGVAGTVAGNGIVNIQCGGGVGAMTLTGQMVGLECDLITNVTAGSNAVIAARLQTAATTRAATAGEGALVIDSRATVARVCDFGVKNTSGTHFAHRFTSATTLSTATTIAHDIDLITSVTPGAIGITALRLQTAATTKASTAGEGALVIDSRATVARVCDFGVRNTSGTHFAHRFTSATTLSTATTIAHDIDLITSVTPGAIGITALRLQTAATTKASTAGEGALVIDSRCTVARTCDFGVRNTSGTHFIHRYTAAVTLSTATTIAHDIDLITNVTPGALGITGLRLQGAATTKADTAAEGMLVIDNRATLARTIDCQIRNTGQATGVWTMRYGAAATLAAAITGLRMDLSTNVTAGTQTVTGVNVSLPTGTGANIGISITHPGTYNSGVASYGVQVNASGTTGTVCGIRSSVSAPAAIAGYFTNDSTSGATAAPLQVRIGNSIVSGQTLSAYGQSIFFGPLLLSASQTVTQSGGMLYIGCFPLIGISASTFTQTGSLVRIENAPETQTYNGSGILLNISHVPGATAGTDTTTGIQVSMSPAAAASVVGAKILLGSTVRSYGLQITHDGSVAGANSVNLRLDGDSASIGIEFETSTTLAVSNANEGRLRYNDTAKSFQASGNAGAYYNLLAPSPTQTAFAASPYTVLASDFAVYVDATGGASQVNLPAATGSGRVLAVKKTDASGNAVTVQANGAETIDGANAPTLAAQYDSMLIQDSASGVWSKI